MTELSKLQTDIGLLLNTECFVLSHGSTVGAAGGTKSTYTTGTTGLYCRISPIGKIEESVYKDKLVGKVGYTAALPFDTSITIRDRLSIGSKILEVVGVKSYPSYPALIRAICIEVND